MAVGLVAIAPQAAAASPATGSGVIGCAVEPQTEVEAAFAERLVDLVNAHRDARGLRRLPVGPALERSATWKARHMARNGYLSHTDLPGTGTLAQRLRNCGFEGDGWGEVLAAGQRRPGTVLRAWLASPSHRVIIDARWCRATGAGVARSPDGRLYWVLDFGA